MASTVFGTERGHLQNKGTISAVKKRNLTGEMKVTYKY